VGIEIRHARPVTESEPQPHPQCRGGFPTTDRPK
jgi:hypothetical protein